jgi:hypothetical protein
MYFSSTLSLSNKSNSNACGFLFLNPSDLINKSNYSVEKQ